MPGKILALSPKYAECLSFGLFLVCTVGLSQGLAEGCEGRNEAFHSLGVDSIGDTALLGFPSQYHKLCFNLCIRANCTVIGYQKGESKCWLGGVLVEGSESTSSAPPDLKLFLRSSKMGGDYLIGFNGSTSTQPYTSDSDGTKLYDGIKSGDVFFDTDVEFEPWVRLTFMTPSLVKRMVVWNRNENSSYSPLARRERSFGMEFRVAGSVETLAEDRSLCTLFLPMIALEQPISCDYPVVGQLLQIKTLDRTDAMNLHEVEVYGVPLF